jgi:flagellar hook protein FlgE
MYSGVSGLRAHQVKMDVIGNNIANVNTLSYKSSNISFQEVLGQTMSRATQPTDRGLGGTNPSQIGLGVTVGSIGVNHAEGSIQTTDNPDDLAIDGSGYFVTNNGIRTSYTRAGNFTMDSAGNMVTSTGEKVMGWNSRGTSGIDYARPIEPINLANISMPSTVTNRIDLEGNFDINSEDFDYNMTVYDSLGEAHVITFKFTNEGINGDGNLEFSFEIEADNLDDIDNNTGTIEFDEDGVFDSLNHIGNLELEFNNGSRQLNIDIRVPNEDRIAARAINTSITGRQNGHEAGSLVGTGIDSNGNIIGNFSNGRDEVIATIALANFINPAGLEKAGNNSYVTSFNSGEAQIGRPGTGDRGLVKANSLEMSNVDLAKEFTEMIVAQRGYQANSRVISTSDEMLTELVNIKR